MQIWCGRWEEAETELLRADTEFALVRPAARGYAVVLLADLGEAERARDLAERYLRQLAPSDRAARAAGLGVLVSASVRCSEHDNLDDALGELQSIAAVASTESHQALATSSAGAVASARGESDRARQLFEDAVDLFSRCGAPSGAALARLDLARALRDCGRPAAAAKEAHAARETFGQLGAARDLELRNVDYRVMDAERIELDADSVDGALCRFGYMLMADPG